jgi:TctA family transporter
MSSGSPFIFFSRPISMFFIALTALLSIVMFRVLRRVPKEVRTEDEKF